MISTNKTLESKKRVEELSKRALDVLENLLGDQDPKLQVLAAVELLKYSGIKEVPNIPTKLLITWKGGDGED